MAQSRPRATRKHCGHPLGAATNCDMSNGVHPLMQAVKPTALKASVDRASRYAKAHQLPARHDTVLLLRELSQTTINIGVRSSIRAFTTHIVVNARLVPGRSGRGWHVADGASVLRNRGAPIVPKVQRKGGPSPPVPPLALIP